MIIQNINRCFPHTILDLLVILIYHLQLFDENWKTLPFCVNIAVKSTITLHNVKQWNLSVL